MNPTKHKILVSIFLLILFYFPKNLNGFVNVCDGRNCHVRSRSYIREFERLPLERENRMVNVRDRVGTERLVNNRRIVDSDSRISENLASRSFDFPRLAERTRESRVCEVRRENNQRESNSKRVRIQMKNRNFRLSNEDNRVSDRIVDRTVRVQNRDDRESIRQNRRVEDNSRRENRNRRVEERNDRINERAQNRLIREDLETRINIRDTRAEGRIVRVLNRETRLADRNIREVREIRDTSMQRAHVKNDARNGDTTRRVVNLRDTSRASVSRLATRTLDSSRRTVRQEQRTNDRSIRFMDREQPETNRRFMRRNVDMNNNRVLMERNENVSERDRRFGNHDSRVNEVDVRVREYIKKNNDISQWSHILTTTFAVLLLAQIITSSNTKKFGIPHISHFLHSVKEKIY